MEHETQQAVDALRRLGSARVRDGMARFGLGAAAATSFGVPVGDVRQLASKLKRASPRARPGGTAAGRGARSRSAPGARADGHAEHDHRLALALWETGWYEARMLAVFVDEPALVTRAQMDRWSRGFDNWGVCDTACFHLFDRTPHAWAMIARWAPRRGEFVRRAAFALLASVALHDKGESDEPFVRSLPLIEAAAADERNFVRKGVSWALRALGARSPGLHAAALELAERLSVASEPAARWVGTDARRDLARPLVVRRLARKAAAGRRARR